MDPSKERTGWFDTLISVVSGHRGGALQALAIITMTSSFACSMLVAYVGTAWFLARDVDTPQYVVEQTDVATSHRVRIAEVFEPIVSFPNIQNVPRAPRAIDALTITDVVPDEGRLVAIDLVAMNTQLYEDGEKIAEYPLMGKGRPGTHWETPSGFYTIHTKEREHYSSIGGVYMPYSMQFFGNYFIHGRTYYPDGTETASTYSGGCIRMETEYAKEVYDFADVGTRVFVYDPPEEPEYATLQLRNITEPSVTASAYLIADLDTGHVYAEANPHTTLPMGNVTKLMTAIVANETINYTKRLALNDTVFDGAGLYRYFSVEELMYPLLMSSNDAVAKAMSGHLGDSLFVSWMNNAAEAYAMTSTTYVDSSGESTDNISTVEDLYRLAWYIAHKKSFAFNVLKEDEVAIHATDGATYSVTNVNDPAHTAPFVGGKAGLQQDDAMLSLLRLIVDGEERTFVLAVLGSEEREKDVTALAEWIEEAVDGVYHEGVACVACVSPAYRTISRP